MAHGAENRIRSLPRFLASKETEGPGFDSVAGMETEGPGLEFLASKEFARTSKLAASLFLFASDQTACELAPFWWTSRKGLLSSEFHQCSSGKFIPYHSRKTRSVV